MLHRDHFVVAMVQKFCSGAIGGVIFRRNLKPNSAGIAGKRIIGHGHDIDLQSAVIFAQ